MTRRAFIWPAGLGVGLSLVLMVWVLAAGAAYGQADKAAIIADGVGTPTARLVRVSGTADVIEPGDGSLVRNLAVGDDIARGETLAISDEGRAVLYLADGSRLFLAGGTELRLDQIFFAPEQERGRLAASVLAGLVLVEPGGLARLPEPALHLAASGARLTVEGRGRAWLAREGDAATAGILGEGQAVLRASGQKVLVTADRPAAVPGRGNAPQRVAAESLRDRVGALANWPAG